MKESPRVREETGAFVYRERDPVLVKEGAGDRLTHDTVKRLQETWITPLDRFDIHGLISKQDDVLDLIEAVSERMVLFELSTVRPPAIDSQSDEVSSNDRRTDMQVTLHATRGSWLGYTTADPSSVTVSPGASPCVLTSLVADQTPGINEITGTLLGYTATRQIVQMPAAIGHVDVVATSLPPL